MTHGSTGSGATGRRRSTLSTLHRQPLISRHGQAIRSRALTPQLSPRTLHDAGKGNMGSNAVSGSRRRRIRRNTPPSRTVAAAAAAAAAAVTDTATSATLPASHIIAPATPERVTSLAMELEEQEQKEQLSIMVPMQRKDSEEVGSRRKTGKLSRTKGKAASIPTPALGASVSGKVIVEFTMSALNTSRIAEEVRYTITANHRSQRRRRGGEETLSRPLCSSGATRALLRGTEPPPLPPSRGGEDFSERTPEGEAQRLKHHSVRFSADFSLPDVAEGSKVLLLLTRTGDIGVGPDDSHRAVVLSRSVHLLDTAENMRKDGAVRGGASICGAQAVHISSANDNAFSNNQSLKSISLHDQQQALNSTQSKHNLNTSTANTQFRCSSADNGRASSRSSCTGALGARASFSSVVAIVACDAFAEGGALRTQASERGQMNLEEQEQEGLEEGIDEEDEEAEEEEEEEQEEGVDNEESAPSRFTPLRWRRDSAVCSLSIEYVNSSGAVVRTKADVPAHAERFE